MQHQWLRLGLTNLMPPVYKEHKHYFECTILSCCFVLLKKRSHLKPELQAGQVSTLQVGYHRSYAGDTGTVTRVVIALL